MPKITSAAVCDLKHIFAQPEWRAGGSSPASYGNFTFPETELASMSDSAILCQRWKIHVTSDIHDLISVICLVSWALSKFQDVWFAHQRQSCEIIAPSQLHNFNALSGVHVRTLLPIFLGSFLLVSSATAQTQSITLTPGDTNQKVWGMNAAYRTRASGHFEDAAFAQTILETYKINPTLDPHDALDQLNKMRSQYDAKVSGTYRPYDFQATDALDTGLGIASLFPGPYGKGAAATKLLFDQYARYEDKELKGEAQITGELTQAHTFSDVQAIQEDTWEQLYAAAKSNPQLKIVVDSFFGTSLKAHVDDDATTVLGNNTDFADHQTLSLLQTHIVNGSLTLTDKDITQTAANGIQSANQLLTQNMQTLKDTQKQQQDFIAYLKNQNAHDAAIKKADDQRKTEMLELSAAQSGVTFAAGIAKLAGNPKLANTISTGGGAAIQIANAVSEYAHTAATMGTLGSSLGAAVLTGNVASAVFQVVGLFAGGPSTDQLIMDQLKAVREDIKQLHLDMTDRFDQIDKRLTFMQSDIDNQFLRVNFTLGSIQGNTDEILGDLSRLQSQIPVLQLQINQSIATYEHTQLSAYIDNHLHYQETTGTQLQYSDYANYAGDFYSWAIDTASSDNNEPVNNRSLDDDQFGDSLASATAYDNIAYFYKIVATKFPHVTLYGSPADIVNPRDWAIASAAYVELEREWPDYARRYDPTRRDNLARTGQTMQQLLQSLAVNSDGTANYRLLNVLIANYEKKITNLTDIIKIYETTLKSQMVPSGDTMPFNEKLDLWGGPDQSVDYVPSLSSLDRCPGLPQEAPSLPAPSTDFAKVIPPIFRLAQQLNQGQLSICTGGYLQISNIHKVPTQLPSGIPVVGGSTVMVDGGTPSLTFPILFHKTDVQQVDAWIVSATKDVPSPNNPSSWITNNWTDGVSLSSQWDSGHTLYSDLSAAPATSLDAYRTDTLNSYNKARDDMRSAITSFLHSEQHSLYHQIADALSGHTAPPAGLPSLHDASEELKGAKELLTLYAELALPSTTNDDDLTRALLFGNQAILGGDDVAALYQTALNHGTDGDGKDLDKISVGHVGAERILALRDCLLNRVGLTAQQKITQHYEFLDAAVAELKNK
jgi:hypothetical protein